MYCVSLVHPPELMFFFLMFKLFVLLRALWEGLRRTECNLLGSKIPVPSVKQRRILLIQQVKHVNTQSLFPFRVYPRAYFFPDSSNSQYVYVRERKDLDVDGRKIWVILARSSPETSCAEKSGVLRVKDYKQSVALESDGGCGTRGSTWGGDMMILYPIWVKVKHKHLQKVCECTPTLGNIWRAGWHRNQLTPNSIYKSGDLILPLPWVQLYTSLNLVEKIYEIWTSHSSTRHTVHPTHQARGL